MRSHRRSASSLETVSEVLRAFVGHRLVELSGLGLVGLIGAVTVALATWSVQDPSLNHAIDGPVRNLLGFPGAVAADLAMQLLGLGTLALLVPPVLWGLRLMRLRRLGQARLRLGLWVLGTGAASAVASALPPSDRWPLPTGLGGVAGDALLGAARTVTGLTGSPGAALVGFVFAGIATLSLTAACGFAADAEARAPRDERAPAPNRRPMPDEGEDGREDEPGLGALALGALAHGAMSAKAGLRRRLEAWTASREDDFVPAGPRPPAARRMPVFEEALPRAEPARRAAPPQAEARRPEPAEPVFEAPVEAPPPRPSRVAPIVGAAALPSASAPILHDEDEEEDFEPAAPAPVPPPAPVSRVAPPPPAPKPGKRLTRDAQPSLLDEGDYQLPPLTVLAEPKKAAAPSVSADALEQNATLLESTLEDFGVRGEIINVRPGPVVTLYELEPAPGTKSSRVISLADDIARSMSAVSARVAVVQGRNAIGIELP
ncbi:MAG TPA: DNA translocase FtsK 4TM domain-containing protein, partial [Beijerinckiaceae bacterium]